jgi:O-antigen/teichoic acid export membrane protein
VQTIVRSDFARSSALLFAATMALNACNYAFHFIASHRLGPQIYGEVSSLISLVSLISIPSAIMSTVVAKYIAEFMAAGERGRARWFYSWLLRVALSLGLVVVLLFGALQTQIGAYLSIANAPALLISAGVICLGLAAGVLRSTIQGAQDFAALSIVVLLEGLGKVAIAGLAIIAGLGLVGAIGGIFLANLMSASYAWYSTRFLRLASAEPGPIDRRVLARLIVVAAGSSIAITVPSFLDIVLVKHFFDATTAGLYSAISLVGKVFLFVLGVLPAVILPRAASQRVLGVSSRDSLVLALGLSALASGVGLSLLVGFPQMIVRAMVGSAYLPIIPYLPEYALAMIALGATSIVSAYKIGRQEYAFVAGLVLIAIGECTAIALYHSTIRDVIHILLLGNALGLLQSLIPWKVIGRAERGAT